MSRTIRRHYKTRQLMRDGQQQHASKFCDNHGGCPWCEGNRTFQDRRAALDWVQDFDREYLQSGTHSMGGAA